MVRVFFFKRTYMYLDFDIVLMNISLVVAVFLGKRHHRENHSGSKPSSLVE